MSHPAPPSAPAEFLVLHGRHTSLVLENHADEAPIWRYWGPRLPDGTTPGAPLRDGRPLPSFMLDFDQPLTTAPTFGVGWFGQSALLAHRSGQQFAQAFSACTVEWVAPGSALVVDAAPLRVFDTSALAVLLEFRREALAAGLRFAVQGLPQALQGMAGLYGVDGLLNDAA